jgi:YD repeat-containing protein
LLTSRIDSDGPTLRSAYREVELNPVGQLLAETDAARASSGEWLTTTTRYERAASGAVRSQIQPDGTQLLFTNNLVGWASKVELLSENTSVSSIDVRHDHLGRVRELKDPSGAVTKIAYDAFGTVTTLTIPGAPPSVRRQMYDALGRLEERVAADGSRIRAAYNEQGDLQAIYRGDNLLREWEYDLFGRVVAQTDYNLELDYATVSDRRVRQTFEYDARSRVSKQTIQLGSREVLTTSTDWTAKEGGWERRLTRPSGTAETISWDLAGNWRRLITPNSVTAANWQSGLLMGRRTSSGSWALQDSATYDPFSRRHKFTYSTGDQAALVLTAVRRAFGRTVAITRESSQTALSTLFAYDPKSRLVRLIDGSNPPPHTDGVAAADWQALASDQGFTFKRDPVGELLEIKSAANSAPWRHQGQRDPGYRLRSVSLFGGPYNTVTHDAQGRVKSFGPWTYSYSTDGRLLRVERDGLVQESYAYTADGRLAAVLRPDGIERFVWDGPRMVASEVAVGSRWEASWAPTGAAPIEWRTDEGSTYLLEDERRSVAGWVQPGGPLVLASYDAYGRMQVRSADADCAEKAAGDTCAGVKVPPFGFSGVWRSPRTGLLKMGERWYRRCSRSF